MKRFLTAMAMLAAIAACTKVESPTADSDREEKKGTEPSITGLSSETLIVYPAEFSIPETLVFSVRDAARVKAEAGNGLSAAVVEKAAGTWELEIRAETSLGKSSSVSVTAENEFGKDSFTINVEKAYVELDRESFESKVAGASLVLGVSSNVGMSFKVDASSSSWLHASSSEGCITVTVERNAAYESRFGKVIVSDRRNRFQKEFSVTQAAAPNYSKLERDALVALYNAADGPNWKRLSAWESSVENWCTDAPIATWYGVEVNGEGHVVYLHLNDLGLKGTLPEELGDLVFLQELWICSNDLSGDLPARMGEMQCLKDFQADGMSLSGDLSASSLSKIASHLKCLSLSGNLFTGGFPEWVSQMPESANFWLQGNCLSGQVPAAVVAHPRWNQTVLDGSGLTVGQINMSQREGYSLQE